MTAVLHSKSGSRDNELICLPPVGSDQWPTSSPDSRPDTSTWQQPTAFPAMLSLDQSAPRVLCAVWLLRALVRRLSSFVQVSASKTIYSPLPEEDSLHDTNVQKANLAFGAVVVKYHIAAEEVATSSL